MVRRRIFKLSLLVLVLAVLAGCFNTRRTANKRTGQSVSLQSVSFDELEQAIGVKNGSVVVVDVWASW
jgi:hypothetical protein